MRAKMKLVNAAPTIEKQRVGGRKSDADYGRDGQKYLTPDQVAILIKTARQNTYGLRDALMISLTASVSPSGAKASAELQLVTPRACVPFWE
jgi:hypothetical protein